MIDVNARDIIDMLTKEIILLKGEVSALKERLEYLENTVERNESY